MDDARDDRPSGRWLWCRLETSHAPVLSPPTHQAPGPLSRTGQLLLSPLWANIPTSAVCCMLYVVCDFVICCVQCPLAMFRTVIVSVMLLQLGAEL